MALAKRAQKDLNIDLVYANELIVTNNLITGDFVATEGSGGSKKAEIVKKICLETGVELSDTVFIGDSPNDNEAFSVVGLSIGIGGKLKADHVVNGINGIIPILARQMDVQHKI